MKMTEVDTDYRELLGLFVAIFAIYLILNALEMEFVRYFGTYILGLLIAVLFWAEIKEFVTHNEDFDFVNLGVLLVGIGFFIGKVVWVDLPLTGSWSAAIMMTLLSIFTWYLALVIAPIVDSYSKREVESAEREMGKMGNGLKQGLKSVKRRAGWK